MYADFYNRIINHVFKCSILILKVVLIGAGVLVGLRLFVVDVYRIPSDSMNDKLEVGDFIVANKLKFSLFSSFFSYFGYDSAPQNGEILVFRNSLVGNTLFVKRCVGTPNQMFSMKRGVVYINGIAQEESSTVKQLYFVWYNDLGAVKGDLFQSGKSIGYISLNKYFTMEMNVGEKSALIKQGNVDSITIVNKLNERESQLLNRPEQAESVQNVGEFRIPFRGLEISLDTNLSEVYLQAIKQFEGVEVLVNNGKYYLDGQQAKHYIFKYNYYFMLGDNRDDSYDSRFYGIIPKHLLVASYINKI
ncbi:signal peptidase I [Sphingobacterium oryzagri]|uniref:Signal peptidase I n=1 Tax=Sphingobacterium oryzagri TaxID=3025669 RepID=A0ABY7WKN9_9SPHI|nr:signal peptidase I [Sphingobacterium sp. KACC 22765]WDF69713.1 signal peptidase I [Sphingobacterium sp. KACC 22765]